MSVTADYPERLNLAEQVARIESLNAETAKLTAQQRNLMAEHSALEGEQRKFYAEFDKMAAEQRKLLVEADKRARDRAWLPWQVVATGLTAALMTVLLR